MKRSSDELGSLYEQYIAAQLSLVLVNDREWQLKYGDTTCKTEIKYDRKLHKTGNLYIEGAESRREGGALVLSGPHKECITYLIGDCSRALTFNPRVLCLVLQNAKLTNSLKRTLTSCGVTMPYIELKSLSLEEYTWDTNPLHCEHANSFQVSNDDIMEYGLPT